MSKPDPARYRTTNWKSYNEALKRRGSLLIWLDKDMVWLAPKAGRTWATAGVLRCGDPVLSDGEGAIRPAAPANDAGWCPASWRWQGWIGRFPTSPP